jgi:two-component system response regulator PrrA
VVARLRAIVADDDPEMLLIVGDAVEGFGIDVARAESGHELLVALAEDGPFDFIVTDVSMPWMTGLQVMHSVRTAGQVIPLIVMTALRDQWMFDQVEHLGGRAILLLKPFTFEQLRNAVATCIRDAQAETR